MDGTSIGSIATPGTGNFTTFQASSLSAPFNATAGNHTLQFTALGGDASFNGSGDFLSFQVSQAGSGGSIACDIGPSYNGNVPAAATQAGFTHCAANYDFTQTQSWTDNVGINGASPATHQWSNMASWFICQQNSTATGMLFYYGPSGQVGCDTAHQKITMDGSTQVLALSYYLTDKNAGLYSNSPATADFSGPPPGNVGTTFPEQSYGEFVFKMDTTNTCGAGGCLIWGPFYYAVNYNVGNPCFVEQDWDEVYSNVSTTNTATGIWNPTCGTAGHAFGPANPTQSPAPVAGSYGTYGALWTGDNVGTQSQCNYWAAGVVGGIPASGFKSCTTLSVVPPSTAPVFTARQLLYLDEGPESSGQGGNNWTATSETTYIQRLTIWVCPNPVPGGSTWQNGNCYNNPVITTHP
jgi:hypothetical protein